MSHSQPHAEPDFPNRRHPTHGVLDEPDHPTIVYVTVCTKDRETWLANHKVHTDLVKAWQNATAWLVGRYLIMPDHTHFFCSPNDPNIDLDTWCKYWKSQFSKQHRNPAHHFQTDHWDRRLRSHESYDTKWDYVVHNPVRHGLVQDSKDWPYHGELHELRWF
jgi:REP element-mobilizing transposase RayT